MSLTAIDDDLDEKMPPRLAVEAGILCSVEQRNFAQVRAL
jgi:hypothetical protein